MKAVLPMAGKGTRMANYYKGPKQLLHVGDKPILEHILCSLPSDVDECIFVTGGPYEEYIKEHFTSGEYLGKPIRFVQQSQQLGLAHAFCEAQRYVDDRWFGAVSDDIVDPDAIRELFTHDLAVLACRVSNPENFGALVADDAGNLVRAVEKPEDYISDLVWTGHMIMDKSFFESDVALSARGEYEVPDVWNNMISRRNKKIQIVETTFWLPINTKEQHEVAEKYLQANQ
ncbi:MAG: nucleotidyltransferase family protein [bacterium]|nr:nucleotidyltransferase family protein [bacterium]